MWQIRFLRLKRLARRHECAFLIVHHTRKDGDLTNTDAIGGASAIVNQARVALLIARMTKDEAKNFPAVLSSQLWRYFRVVDAKTNLSPPSADTHWYQIISHDLANAEPPTYPHGDGVQVVDEIELVQLNTSPVASSTNDAAKPANCRSIIGMRQSLIRPSPTRSSIGSCTTRTG
jgi:hypothetical protein